MVARRGFRRRPGPGSIVRNVSDTRRPRAPLDALPHVASRARESRAVHLCRASPASTSALRGSRNIGSGRCSQLPRRAPSRSSSPRLIETIVSSNASWSTWAAMPVPAGYSLTIIWSGADGIRPSRTSDAVSASHPGRQVADAKDAAARVVIRVAVDLHAPADVRRLLPRLPVDGGQQRIVRVAAQIVGDVTQPGNHGVAPS